MEDETKMPISFCDLTGMKPALTEDEPERLNINNNIWSKNLTNVDLEKGKSHTASAFVSWCPTYTKVINIADFLHFSPAS
jgi:hypothetical protein